MLTVFNFADTHFVGLSLMYYGGLIVWLASRTLHTISEAQTR